MNRLLHQMKQEANVLCKCGHSEDLHVLGVCAVRDCRCLQHAKEQDEYGQEKEKDE